ITEMKKLVFSKTLAESAWQNTKLVKGDMAEQVNLLKAQVGKDILAYGGPTFASALITAGLVDELHLFVNPTAVGSGRSMFKDVLPQGCGAAAPARSATGLRQPSIQSRCCPQHVAHLRRLFIGVGRILLRDDLFHSRLHVAQAAGMRMDIKLRVANCVERPLR